METMRDDPALLLFACQHCGHWPMAFQADQPFGKEKSFVCPRCRAHASFLTRGGMRLHADDPSGPDAAQKASAG
jgi:hypothetical protein